jgi:hypothetical protein
MTPIQNVEIELHYGNDRASVSWEHDGARFHYWADLPSLDVDGPIYKNPPLGTKSDRSNPAYFDTRKLQPTSGPCRKMLDQAHRAIVEGDLVAKAYEARAAQKAAEAAKRQADHAAHVEKERFGTHGRAAAIAARAMLPALEIVSAYKLGPADQAMVAAAIAQARAALDGAAGEA